LPAARSGLLAMQMPRAAALAFDALLTDNNGQSTTDTISASSLTHQILQ
jgi:hypothetical protein